MLTDHALPVPSLADADIVRAVAGIRPCRRGGLRLEPERVARNGRWKTVIHNYGHGGCGVTLALGCAEGAAAHVGMAIGEDTPPIAVLGGGVVGLASAYELARRGLNVTLYAEHFGMETTSAIAGALWLPTGLDFPGTPRERAKLNSILRRSGERLRALLGKSWGVETIRVYEPADSPKHDHHFESGVIEPPTPLEDLPVGAVRQPGTTFETMFVHTHRFLDALMQAVRGMGVQLVQRRFESRDDVLALPEPVAINCLALGAKTLFDDDRMYPARGVLVHARPQNLGYALHNGYQYMYPRENALILGGTFEEGVDDPTVPEDTVRDILAHHRAFFGQ